MATVNTARMESFPFDSKADGYDSDGYPIYDRAVDSWLLRDTFAKFFTNGVFPSPGNALTIGKAASGIAVTIQPGIAIINGAMGGVKGEDPITLTLDTSAPQGNVCYSIMLRYDNREDARSLYFRVDKGEAGSTPQPSAPDQSTPSVYELRLGYVIAKSGEPDLANATVVNEKGMGVCPYAAPFEEIDVSGIVTDFRASAKTMLNEFEGELGGYDASAQQLVQQFVRKLDSYQGLLDSALDETTAGHLQSQITELQEAVQNIDLSGAVDNVTLEYSLKPGESIPTLHVKDDGIGKEQLALGIDEPGGLASHEACESLRLSVADVSGDLATVLFELHLAQIGQLDLDTIAVFEFPGDVQESQGEYEASGNKYFAIPGE